MLWMINQWNFTFSLTSNLLIRSLKMHVCVLLRETSFQTLITKTQLWVYFKIMKIINDNFILFINFLWILTPNHCYFQWCFTVFPNNLLCHWYSFHAKTIFQNTAVRDMKTLLSLLSCYCLMSSLSSFSSPPLLSPGFLFSLAHFSSSFYSSLFSSASFLLSSEHSSIILIV